jgi:molybdate transport system substrate-binding protein
LHICLQPPQTLRNRESTQRSAFGVWRSAFPARGVHGVIPEGGDIGAQAADSRRLSAIAKRAVRRASPLHSSLTGWTIGPMKWQHSSAFGVTATFMFLFAVESMRPAQAETVTVAAAADLTYCIEELDRVYLQSHPNTELKVSTGSSGNFSAQIQNGAPFDVFLSADIQYPKNLVTGGFVDQSTLTVYAIGKIVLWTTKPESVNLDEGLDILLDRSAVKKIAIANPEHAPYGRAAKAALEKKGLWPEVQDRIVQGENISQTAQYVQTGNADAGFVALSLVLAPNLKNQGRYIEIDPALYPKLEQAMVLTTAGSKREPVRDYFQFLRSTAARKIFDQFGFTLPTPNG